MCVQMYFLLLQFRQLRAFMQVKSEIYMFFAYIDRNKKIWLLKNVQQRRFCHDAHTVAF